MRLPRLLQGALRAAPAIYPQGGLSSEPIPRLDLRLAPDDVATADDLSRNPLTAAEVWMLAFRMGALPLKVFRIDPKTAARAEAPDHPGYRVLRRPNPKLTRNLLISGTVRAMLRSGKAGWVKIRPSPGEPPTELWPIPTSQLRLDRDERELFRGVKIGAGGREITLTEENVCLFRLIPDDDRWADGLAPLEPLRDAASMGYHAITLARDAFRTGLWERSYIVIEGLSEENVKRWEGLFGQIRGDRIKIPVLPERPDEVGRLGPGPDPNVVAKGMDLARGVIRDTLGVPADGDRRALFENAIQPIADAIEQELERSLFTEWEDDPAFPEFQFREVLKGDFKDQIEAHAKAVQTMIEEPDEARRALNYPARGGRAASLWGPLNLTPVDAAPTDGVPREKDTAGGLGGSEGKGIIPTAKTGRQRSGLRQGRDRWGEMRRRLVERQARALAGRLGGVLHQEASRVGDQMGARAGAVALPSPSELARAVEASDPEVARLLRVFMDQVSGEAASQAADVIAAQAGEVAEVLDGVIASRVDAVTSRFSEIRADRLAGLLRQAAGEGFRPQELSRAVGELYSDLRAHITDGVARTEMAWAHEQTALATWSSAGVTSVEVQFGGGPCSTGVCEENAQRGAQVIGAPQGNVGYSFEGTDAPPFHPGCTCFAVPYVAGEEVA